MGPLHELKRIAETLSALKEKLGMAKSEGAVSSAGFSADLGGASADTMLTGGVKRPRKKKPRLGGELVIKSKGEGLEKKASGIKHRVDGKSLKTTGLSDKEKDEYLFGEPSTVGRRVPGVKRLAKATENLEKLSEYLEYLTAPDIEEDFEDKLEKCTAKSSALIKNKMGVWRRIGGRPCFICEDGVIHAGPKPFLHKKAATLRDELRADKKRAVK